MFLGHPKLRSAWVPGPTSEVRKPEMRDADVQAH